MWRFNRTMSNGNPDKKLILMGTGGHASVLMDIIIKIELNILGVCDPALFNKNILEWNNLKVLGNDDYLLGIDPENYLIVNGLGSLPGNNSRLNLQDFIDKNNFLSPSLIHPFTSISNNASISEKGVQIMAGAIVQYGSQIMENTIINTGVSIDHDCLIHKNVSISPGATLCGGVEIEENVFIGSGAKIIQGIKIKKGSIIGAGSTIVKDVDENSKIIQ